MSQPITKRNFARASLRTPRSAHTVLLRMAQDDARAARIRELYEARKADDPRFTWQKLADHVGVSVRAAQAWPKTGGVDPENLDKMAEALHTTADYIWRGARDNGGTPDLLGVMDPTKTSLDRIEAKLDRILEHLAISEPDEIAGMFSEASAEHVRRSGRPEHSEDDGSTESTPTRPAEWRERR